MKLDLGKVAVACDYLCERELEEEYLKQDQFDCFPNNLFFEINQKFNLNFFEIPEVESELVKRLDWPLRMIETKFKNNAFPHKIVSFILPTGRIHNHPNKPAVAGPSRAEYFVNGKYHRIDGPARVFGFDVYYHINDRLHREDGPAIIRSGIYSWYLFGTFYANEDLWEDALKNFKKEEKI